MIGEVMYIDNFGNCVTNIPRVLFEKQQLILKILKLTSEIFYSKIFIENTPIL
jgi:S-adenosylmethionine hydrolase